MQCSEVRVWMRTVGAHQRHVLFRPKMGLKTLVKPEWRECGSTGTMAAWSNKNSDAGRSDRGRDRPPASKLTPLGVIRSATLGAQIEFRRSICPLIRDEGFQLRALDPFNKSRTARTGKITA